MNLDKSTKRIAKKAKKGFQGYPMITIAYYGPDDKIATKVAIGFIEEENSTPQLEKFSKQTDVRADDSIQSAIIKIIERSGAKTVVMTDAILGCPHETGVDFPDGAECPRCTFWQGRNAQSGKTSA